jgi:hypothetical protein
MLVALAIGFLVPLFASAPAHAQATRTWVSGVGDDANPCSRTAPCKTWAGAISKTAPAGEIDCLDPGGFGAVTITKSITIDCSETVGSSLVSGTNAIVINAQSTDRVVLRNLRMMGLNSGLVGVNIFAASFVSIENCVITQFTQQGVFDHRPAGTNKLLISNTTITMNAGSGIDLSAGSSNSVEIVNVRSVNNLNGLSASTGNFATVQNSVFSQNSTNGVIANAGSVIQLDNSSMTSNATGVNNAGSVFLSNSNVTFNSTGFGGANAVTTYGLNRTQGNAAAGTATSNAGGATSALGTQ